MSEFATGRRLDVRGIKPVRREAARKMTIRIRFPGSTQNAACTCRKDCFQKPVLRECHKNGSEI
jgi:hypothetical protein